MKKEVKAVFTLTPKEIKEAFYEYYVRKLKSNNINGFFGEGDIQIESYEFLNISLTITEERELD